MVVGSLLLFIIVAVQGNISEVFSLGATQWGWTLLSSVFLLGYVVTWYTALQYAPAWYVATLLVPATLVTNILTTIFITQTISWQQAVSGGLYARSLDLGAVRHVLAQFLDMPLFKGSLRDIDLVIGGHWDGLDVSGSFWVERIIQNEFVLQEAFARADLHFLKRRLHWETHGKLFLDKGWLRNALVRLELEPGYLYFSGRPSAPELNVHAVARVARTRIFVQVTGTRDAPKLELTSEPPYPQEQLLLMLTTGKRWIGVERSSGKSGMTPGLASNFVDYLLFGGERGAIIRMLGLSDISLNADDKKQGITFSKDVTGRLGVGYGVEIKTDPGRQKEWTQRLEGEYRLTDKFLLGVQKEVKPERVSGALGDQKDASSGGRLTPDDLPDDRVFLKYRSSF